MRLMIDIPEEAKLAFDNAESNDLKGCYYDHGGVIGNAIKNGVSLEERPKGEWQAVDGAWACSKCGCNSKDDGAFCQWCGAEMRGVQK